MDSNWTGLVELQELLELLFATKRVFYEAFINFITAAKCELRNERKDKNNLEFMFCKSQGQVRRGGE